MSTLANPLRPSPAAPAIRRPLSERINLRLWVFLGIVALPFLFCLWLILDPQTVVDKGDHYAVDLKWMGNFPLDPVRDDERMIPKDVRALDGKRVRFEG